MNRLKRMWINQPSTLQPLHHKHGVNVLVYEDSELNRLGTVIIYFLSGPVVSQYAFRNCLSNGWKKRSNSE